MMGAMRKPMNKVYVKKPPIVSDPARICFAPTYIMTAPTTPSSTLAERPMMELAVSVRITLSSSRITPIEKTFSSRSLGVIALYDPYAPKRFRQTPSNLGGDLAAIAKDWPDRLKCFFQGEPETHQETKRQRGHQRADSEQNHQSDPGREQSPGKIHQSSTNQVTHALYVGHD